MLVELKFEQNDVLWLPVFVNGGIETRAVVDTGANLPSVSKSAAARLGLEALPQMFGIQDRPRYWLPGHNRRAVRAV